MVIADPGAELVGLVRSLGDPAPDVAAPELVQQAALIRRRFGVSLPPPFAGPVGPDDPVRPATAFDGAAIAAIKWRAFGTNYRNGVLPDDFLDRREVVPPPPFWVGRAMVPPSRRHRLLVWGRPGAVHGYVDAGPRHPDDDGAADRAEPSDSDDDIGEVYELYVDPSAQGRGGGARLLAAAGDGLRRAGFRCVELSVLTTNHAAQAFYRAQGWRPTGRVVHVDLGSLAFDEARYTDCPDTVTGGDAGTETVADGPLRP